MLEYIYFVKCPDCEDEPFSFFDEAKEFAISCLSKKPIITQIEVDRNDFGECQDSCDLGTVWSWEEMMDDVSSEVEPTTFAKADTFECDDCFNQEFDSLDNSLDSVPDNFRKPVPANMTVEDLVEEMEENEDDVECKFCHELFDKSECKHDRDYGWLCSGCQRAVQDHGGDLVISEPALEEAFNAKEKVEFNYDGLEVTLQGPKRDVDDWDEAEESVSHSIYKTKEDVATDIWENFIEEADVTDVDGGLEALEDDTAWNDFLANHFDELLDKYYDKLLAYYKDDATKEYEETHSLNESWNQDELVELEYPNMTATLYGEKRSEDDWDEFEHTANHVFVVTKGDVATAIWENWITEEDAESVLGGLKTLEDDRLWGLYLDLHFDELFEKYKAQVLDYFREEAAEDFRERSQEDHSLSTWAASQEHAYDALQDDFNNNDEASKTFLEEFDDAETHKANLTDCPECGAVSYDMKEQYCANCGLNL